MAYMKTTLPQAIVITLIVILFKFTQNCNSNKI